MSRKRKKTQKLPAAGKAVSAVPGPAVPISGKKRPRLAVLILGNIVVLAVLLLLVCALGEIYCRFVLDSTDAFQMSRVSERWFQRHYQFNASNVRDNVDYMTPVPQGRRRITFLGDSFTAGHGIKDVDRRFGNLIRKMRPEWNVHVLALNGFDTQAEIDGLKRMRSTDYGMDVVVLVYVLNDVADLLPEWAAILEKVYGDKGKEPWLFQHSYFLNMLYYRVKTMRDPEIAKYYSFVEKGYDGFYWETQKMRLREMRNFCLANGASFMVVTFPFLHALGDDYEYAWIHEKLNAFWRELGVPHLDLWELFAEEKPSRLVVGKWDPHPSELAHRLAAGAIAEFVEQNLREKVDPSRTADLIPPETP